MFYIETPYKKEMTSKKYLLNLWIIIGLAIYPIIYMYCQNIQEVNISDISLLLVEYIAVAIIILFGIYFIIKSIHLSTLISALCIIYIYNFALFQKGINLVFPNLKYWHIVPIGIVIILHMIYFIKKINTKIIPDIIMIMSWVILGLLLVNLIPAVPDIISKVNWESQDDKNDNMVFRNGKSNLYWIILDECASFKTIQKYYGYTDMKIHETLLNLGFFISEDSRNECGNTDVVITNCLNLEYIANTQMNSIELKALKDNPQLITLFRNDGYIVRGIGNTDWLGIQSVSGGGTGDSSKTIEGFAIRDIILQNSIIGPILQFDGTASAKIILDTLEFLQNEKNITPDNSELNITYICSPHQPFLFNKDGNAVSAANYNNWTDKKYYLEQYIYIMSEITKCVENIIENDPNSIIILESDHGPRFNPEIPLEDRLNILNAVYYKGETIKEIDSKSSVNTWRTIINKLFNYSLENLEVKEGE